MNVCESLSVIITMNFFVVHDIAIYLFLIILFFVHSYFFIRRRVVIFHLLNWYFFYDAVTLLEIFIIQCLYSVFSSLLF